MMYSNLWKNYYEGMFFFLPVWYTKYWTQQVLVWYTQGNLWGESVVAAILPSGTRNSHDQYNIQFMQVIILK